MQPEAITPAVVQDALRAIRSATRLRGSPLLDLEALGQRLSAEGLANSREARIALLPRWLEEITWAQLVRLRGRDFAERAPDRSAERLLALLEADFQAQNVDREAWGVLHFRHFSGSSHTVVQLADRVGVAEKTLRRRIARGYRVLADTLQAEEVAARRQIGAAAGASPYDRLVFVEDAPPRTPQMAMGELLGVVQGTGAPMHLTPEQANGIACFPAAELTTYRVGRIAEWGQPRYRLDERFVALSLLVDLGEESRSGRWQVYERRFTDLRAVLAELAEPAVVLLGPPGSGKSTLLRRLELDLAVEALRREGRHEPGPVSFLVSLNQYRAAPGEPLPAPKAWLEQRWAARFPKLPPLGELLASGGVVLLLDGLNEMPHAGEEDYRRRIGQWKQLLREVLLPGSGNRAVIACRSLDYSAPLSTPALRVPQVRLEPLTDAQVQAFLEGYSPRDAAGLWNNHLAGSALLEALRWPYFLRLLVEDAAETGAAAAPRGLAALFTAFVRRALAREVVRDNPLFAPGALLSEQDCEQLLDRGKHGWPTPYALPEEGRLFPALAGLAYGIQVQALCGESSQARIGYEPALALLGDGAGAEEIVWAGVALGVVEVDQAAGELQFSHQLVQEYFAGRQMAVAPEPERVQSAWRAAEIRPSVRELIEMLPVTEELLPLPQTGWEETTLLASAMVDQPEPFLRALLPHNLALVGRAANLPTVRPKLGASFLDELRWALVARSRDAEADLRARIDAGLALGWLGDPRFQRCLGPYGEYLLPPLVRVPGGVFLIGDDDLMHLYDAGEIVEVAAHQPRHEVAVAGFDIGRFPVTNAEWACFITTGGYEDDRWWDTSDGRRWREGQLPNEGLMANSRFWRRQFQADPASFETLVKEGRFGSQAVVDRWRDWMVMDEARFEAALISQWQPKREIEPRFWRDPRYNNPVQPVVGICWFEARAYCAWLSAQIGRPVRLPTEAEWEASARGPAGRLYPWGDDFDPLKVNLYATRLKQTTPVGVFPEGDSALGIADLAGNVYEWTSSLIGQVKDGQDIIEFPYPYNASDGREDVTAPPVVHRVIRGGGWLNGPPGARTSVRDADLPDAWGDTKGMRIMVADSPELGPKL